MKKITFLVALLLALPLYADLRQQIESATGWVGDSVPISGKHTVCSWDDWSDSSRKARYRDSSSALFVLYEVSGGKIQAIRLSSPECGPTGQSVQWLQNVDPRESVRLLRKLIDGDSVLCPRSSDH